MLCLLLLFRPRPPPRYTLFPYTTLFRSKAEKLPRSGAGRASRRSVKLEPGTVLQRIVLGQQLGRLFADPALARVLREPLEKDRKSTRLNSSHSSISYAVFCLKKKKTTVIDALSASTFPAPPPTAIHTLSLHDALPI